MLFYNICTHTRFAEDCFEYFKYIELHINNIIIYVDLGIVVFTCVEILNIYVLLYVTLSCYTYCNICKLTCMYVSGTLCDFLPALHVYSIQLQPP